jgi:DNA-binding response OmpR family regulator
LLVVADGESTANVVRALNSGANDYIIHPYSDKDFIARIKKMIS